MACSAIDRLQIRDFFSDSGRDFAKPRLRMPLEKLTKEVGSLEQVLRHKAMLPGPGEYEVPDPHALGVVAARLRSTAKHQPVVGDKNDSYIDLSVRRARDLPGPADYPAPRLPAPSGGRFNQSQPKTWLELSMYRAKELPGPGATDPPKLPPPEGGRFNMSNAKSELDWIQYHASKMPGPGAYNNHGSKKISGGRISRARPKTSLEWVEYHGSCASFLAVSNLNDAARGLPGPGTYNPPKAPAIGGGRFNESRPKSELDWVQYFAKQMPGPGQYDHRHPETFDAVAARNKEWLTSSKTASKLTTKDLL
eukprot:CAMPEP_0175985890 /NCGR_PEP_ID=MMETSP0108-20121206/49839_1 /TAXON_ID=195067 ORGANISM="Goniomonas pacifica, Strain CCMP1869" /NCGR_SAMPLE_ID=MMETSP0108 /ASSEMBLY_ACC=CAM_ASM_000204 /LENGTH=307 /DNA_ID=CAMNT_0017316975 /DNA_START=106 /DNA_END=1030 /DNA_ORIENTATION=+